MRRFDLLAGVALLAAAAPAGAAVFCVGTSAELEAALIAAVGNTETDEIRIRGGTYTAPYPDGFEYVVTGFPAYGLTVSGGWSTNCTRSGRIAEDTVLSGANQRPVFRFTSPGGDFKIRNLTIERASIDFLQGALHVDGNGQFGPAVYIDRVIFRQNYAFAALEVETKGVIHLSGCLFHSNYANATGGAIARLLSLGANVPRITNNTFARNFATNYSIPAGLLLDNSAAADPSANVVNNIFWNNENYDV